MADTYTKYLNLTKPEPGKTGHDTKLNNDLDLIDAAIATRPEKRRQTILSAAVDANGVQNFLTLGLGLNFTIDAATTNIEMSFSSGNKEYIYTEKSDQALSVGNGDIVGYVFADYNLATKTVTYGVENGTLNFFSQRTQPVGFLAGEYWFNTVTFKAYRFDGFSWVEIIRLVIGYYIESSGTIISLNPSAINGRYRSPSTAILGNTSYTFNHGVFELHQTSEGGNYSVNGQLSLNGNLFEFEKTYNSNGAVLNFTSTIITLVTYTAPSVINNSGNRLTASYAMVIVDRGW